MAMRGLTRLPLLISSMLCLVLHIGYVRAAALDRSQSSTSSLSLRGGRATDEVSLLCFPCLPSRDSSSQEVLSPLSSDPRFDGHDPTVAPHRRPASSLGRPRGVIYNRGGPFPSIGVDSSTDSSDTTDDSLDTTNLDGTTEVYHTPPSTVFHTPASTVFHSPASTLAYVNDHDPRFYREQKQPADPWVPRSIVTDLPHRRNYHFYVARRIDAIKFIEFRRRIAYPDTLYSTNQGYEGTRMFYAEIHGEVVAVAQCDGVRRSLSAMNVLQQYKGDKLSSELAAGCFKWLKDQSISVVGVYNVGGPPGAVSYARGAMLAGFSRFSNLASRRHEQFEPIEVVQGDIVKSQFKDCYNQLYFGIASVVDNRRITRNSRTGCCMNLWDTMWDTGMP